MTKTSTIKSSVLGFSSPSVTLFLLKRRSIQRLKRKTVITIME